jgi:hypothetical protein
MTDPNGWPDPERPGVPENPERTGAHQVGRFVMIWRPGDREYVNHNGNRCKPDFVAGLDYGGPLLTPAEVVALAAERDALKSRLDDAARMAGKMAELTTQMQADRDRLAAERDDERIRADTNAGAHEAAMRLVRLVEADRDRLTAKNAKMQKALVEALSVMPVFPKEARQIVGMEARYNAAREKALKLLRHDC